MPVLSTMAAGGEAALGLFEFGFAAKGDFVAHGPLGNQGPKRAV